MKSKTVLYIQPTFDTEGPRNIRTANIIESLKSDYNIDVLCLETSSPHRKIEGIKVFRYKLGFLAKYVLLKDISGYKPKGIVRFLSRAINFIMLWFLFPDPFKITTKQLARHRGAYDIVIVSIVPFSNIEVLRAISKHAEKPFKIILDIGDPLSNNAASHTFFSEKRREDYESKALSLADHIVVTNQVTKQYYESKFHITSDKISIIAQGVDLEKLKLPNRAPKIKDKLNMIYAGTFYKGLRDPQYFVEAINATNSPKINIKFFGVSQNLLNLTSSLTKISFHNRVTQDELAIHYASSNCLLYFDNAYGIQTSGKIYELLALKKLILCIYDNEESLVIQEIKDLPNVICVKNNKTDLIIIFESLLNEYDETKCIADYSVKQYSWTEKANQFKKII